MALDSTSVELVPNVSSTSYENDDNLAKQTVEPSALETKDCCVEPCCLCTPCKDQSWLTNPVCMLLRTNITVRMVVALCAAIFLGPMISLGRPVAPASRVCNSQSLYVSTPDLSCSDFGTFLMLIPTNDLDNFQKRIPMCLDNSSNVVIDWSGSSCTVMYYLNTSVSSDQIYCYGTMNIEGSLTAIISKEDTNECQKYGKIEGPGVKSEPVVIYTEKLVSSGNKSASANSLKFTDGYGINNCDITTRPCGNTEFEVRPFLEGPSTLAAKNLYDAEMKKYSDIIFYMFKLPGSLWYRCLKLIVMPLIIALIITSVAALKEMPGAGRLGCVTFFYYLLTTICAAIEALIMCGIFLIPFLKDFGYVGTAYTNVNRQYSNTGEQITGVINAIVPVNGVQALVKGNGLGVIFFSIIAGVAMTNPKESTFLKWFKELSAIMIRIVEFLIELSPLAIFCLLTHIFADKNIAEVLPKVGLFLSAVFVGLAIHVFVVYPLIYFVFTRKNPIPFMINIFPAALIALSISSSIVTLPTTLHCAIKKNKISPDIAKFVCTLGATVNMDGTTIGFPIAIIFVAYGQGIHITFGQMVEIVILSTLSSMGAAPIPQAGLVLLIVMLDGLGIPLEETFALVVAVDWLYDRPETCTNIIGDSFAAGVIDHWFKKYHVENSPEDQAKQHGAIRKISENFTENEQKTMTAAIASEA